MQQSPNPGPSAGPSQAGPIPSGDRLRYTADEGLQ